MNTTIRAFIKPIAMAVARLVFPTAVRRLEQLDDWAQLSFYQAQNQEFNSPDIEETRIIFFGDSITEFWNLAEAFPGKAYINRGIAGQTTSQLLLRFRADVVSLDPKVVVILAGTNDLAGNTGPATLEMITNNYASIADIARANHIQVVFASVLPIHDYGMVKQSEFRPPEQIQALNRWLSQYCIDHGLTYLDYYRHLVDSQGMLTAAYSADGVHPNQEGYAMMAPLAETAIQATLLSTSHP